MSPTCRTQRDLAENRLNVLHTMDFGQLGQNFHALLSFYSSHIEGVVKDDHNIDWASKSYSAMVLILQSHALERT